MPSSHFFWNTSKLHQRNDRNKQNVTEAFNQIEKILVRIEKK